MARAVSVLAALALIGLLAFTAPAAAELKDSIVIKWTYLAQRVRTLLRAFRFALTAAHRRAGANGRTQDSKVYYCCRLFVSFGLPTSCRQSFMAM